MSALLHLVYVHHSWCKSKLFASITITEYLTFILMFLFSPPHPFSLAGFSFSPSYPPPLSLSLLSLLPITLSQTYLLTCGNTKWGTSWVVHICKIKKQMNTKSTMKYHHSPHGLSLSQSLLSNTFLMVEDLGFLVVGLSTWLISSLSLMLLLWKSFARNLTTYLF